MAKVNLRTLSPRQRQTLRHELLAAFAANRNREELQRFLLELLTQSEVVMLARRIQIAKLLLQGKTYEDIRTSLKVGLHTIQGIDRWLGRSFEGYRNALPPLLEGGRKRRTRWHEEGPVKQLRRKFPLHFLLVNLVLDDMEW